MPSARPSLSWTSPRIASTPTTASPAPPAPNPALAAFAAFEADLIRMRAREGMVITRTRGKLRGKQSKLSDRQRRDLYRMHANREYSISDLAELFSVSGLTFYRTLNRLLSP